MSLLRKFFRAIKAQAEAVNTEGGTRIWIEGDQAFHRAIETGAILWSLDLRRLESISAYSRTVRAIDYVIIRLHADGRDYEVEDDAIGFSVFLETLEARLQVPLIEQALSTATPAYGGGYTRLWPKPAIHH